MLQDANEYNRVRAAVNNAINACEIPVSTGTDSVTTLHYVIDFVEDLQAMLGKGSEDEIVKAGEALINKLNGMTADAVFTFAGERIVISDGTDDNAFEVKADKPDSFHALYQFSDGEMLIETLNVQTDIAIAI